MIIISRVSLCSGYYLDNNVIRLPQGIADNTCTSVKFVYKRSSRPVICWLCSSCLLVTILKPTLRVINLSVYFGVTCMLNDLDLVRMSNNSLITVDTHKH